MKRTFYFLVVLLSVACSEDDDGPSTDGLVPLELSQDFLVDERWFLDSATASQDIDINGDGIATGDLSSQFPACDLDSF